MHAQPGRQFAQVLGLISAVCISMKVNFVINPLDVKDELFSSFIIFVRPFLFIVVHLKPSR